MPILVSWSIHNNLSTRKTRFPYSHPTLHIFKQWAHTTCQLEKVLVISCFIITLPAMKIKWRAFSYATTTYIRISLAEFSSHSYPWCLQNPYKNCFKFFSLIFCSICNLVLVHKTYTPASMCSMKKLMIRERKNFVSLYARHNVIFF